MLKISCIILFKNLNSTSNNTILTHHYFSKGSNSGQKVRTVKPTWPILTKTNLDLLHNPPNPSILLNLLSWFTYQSTNCTVRLVLIVATAALTSLGTTSPRNIKQQAIYFPCLGSHLAIMLAGSNTEFVISGTESCSWYAFSTEITGAYEESMKWIRGYGTRLVWNSVISTLMAPSKRREVVKDDMTWEISLFKLV